MRVGDHMMVDIHSTLDNTLFECVVEEIRGDDCTVRVLPFRDNSGQRNNGWYWHPKVSSVRPFTRGLKRKPRGARNNGWYDQGEAK